MSIVRIGEATQALYAELLDQVRASAVVPRSGSFVSKTIGGGTYWYVQRVDGGRKRQIYLGVETPRVRGRDLRVDLLTPGRASAKPVFLPHLNAAATALPGLDYLLHNPVEAVVVAGGGVLTNVPQPARLALHKLWVSRRRDVSHQAKARKDLHQATQLLTVLLTDRPGDIELAWRDLRPSMKKDVRLALRNAEPSLALRIGELVQGQ